MRYRRRAFVALGAMAVALVGLKWRTPSLEREILDTLAGSFSRDLAEQAAALAFAEDLARRLTRDDEPDRRGLGALSLVGRRDRPGLESTVIEAFLMETNAVLAEEDGRKLEFLGGPWDPYVAPCSNPLSSQWL